MSPATVTDTRTETTRRAKAARRVARREAAKAARRLVLQRDLALRNVNARAAARLRAARTAPNLTAERRAEIVAGVESDRAKGLARVWADWAEWRAQS